MGALREALKPRLDHIAIVVPEIKRALPILHKLDWQGGDRIFRHASEGRNLTSLTHPEVAAKLEVLEPSGPSSYLERFLADFGPFRQHHITFYVEEDLGRVRELLVVGMRVRLHPGRDHEIIIHPDSGGTMIQFFPADRSWRSRSGGETQ